MTVTALQAFNVESIGGVLLRLVESCQRAVPTPGEIDVKDVAETHEPINRFHAPFGGFRRSGFGRLERLKNDILGVFKRTRFIDFDDDLITTEPCFSNPEEVLIQDSSAVLLRRALETLPTRSREMLVLRGWSTLLSFRLPPSGPPAQN